MALAVEHVIIFSELRTVFFRKYSMENIVYQLSRQMDKFYDTQKEVLCKLGSLTTDMSNIKEDSHELKTGQKEIENSIDSIKFSIVNALKEHADTCPIKKSFEGTSIFSEAKSKDSWKVYFASILAIGLTLKEIGVAMLHLFSGQTK